MGIKVVKFGGTSLADANQIRKVQKIICADEERCYVVPSAPGKRIASERKITDLLYLCHAHVQQNVPIDEVFQIIVDRYRDIVRDMDISIDLEPQFDDIKKKISDGASADYTASRGEFLIGLILAALLGYDFVDPFEIIFFNKYGKIDIERTQAETNRRLLKHRKAIIPGFYGCAHDGKIKTFPRGGSDITGSIIARGVHADVYENWTDVSGLLMADPNVVDNPRPINTITYKELRELAYMGANVIHDETIFPVREAGIPVKIKNTNRPDDPGTLIVRDTGTVSHTGTITGIAGRKNFTIIVIERAFLNTEIGYGKIGRAHV